ncbi:hypothetical protein VFPFJ_00624 [Purpureocillium lilacinum]|uniref:Uncharacterized protein n=1 Tax=Purpureocillium lilacinum TaxID=33203 RepID=A0A179H8R3_PURLI|nr:hypothetical protein VFPFJ_00624 [Purpureocillium lilacinum]OAQ86554.1 hypothetical protein VFPBJ_00594 [Purpureocillium lilacinum]OAQ94515.1 hypothetical protein VFPFJ_00624 [Purpureocillium lilacinum]
MGGAAPPFMYGAEPRNDSRFPRSSFDPKAVTRASWEPKPRKTQPTGPLVSFNRHPDAHLVLANQQSSYVPLGRRTKTCIKWLRRLQLALRVLQLCGAAGILTLMILITEVNPATAWVLRIMAGISMMHCTYAAYHLSREASGRTPASSAAYQVFAGIADLCVLSAYAYGALAAYKSAGGWATLLADQGLVRYFAPAAYYTLVGCGGLHVVTLSVSLWLGAAFRRISLMPPDMNPLEDHLTARPFHKRNKSSVNTASSVGDEKRLSTPTDARRLSDLHSVDSCRPPSVPFMHTRTGSSHSLLSRDSRSDFPARQYQIVPGGESPRNSACSTQSRVNASMPRSSRGGSYAQLPTAEPGSPQRDLTSNLDVNSGRKPKFTEAWVPTDSLISRTYHRNSNGEGGQPYTALSQRYNLDNSSDSEYEDENVQAGDLSAAGPPRKHPNPLRSHPPPSAQATLVYPATRPPQASLLELSGNERRVSGSRDIADQRLSQPSPWQRQRNSSIQPEDGFYSRPYGDLKPATPPIMIGSGRKVSTGNDFESKYAPNSHGRRIVSGRQAEEGLAAVQGPRRGFAVS